MSGIENAHTKVLNFGSINIDYVYRTRHMVRPGETLASRSLQRHAGGKGANQSVALARAGVRVFHAAQVASDGAWIIEQLQAAGVDCSLVSDKAEHTGHAIIQVDDNGENSILLFGGGNQSLSVEDVNIALSSFGVGDILVLQNEINMMSEIMHQAHAKGMLIYFNPAPFDDSILSYPLEKVSCFIVNETEGQALSGKTEVDDIINTLLYRYPQASVVLTLGANGVCFGDAHQRIQLEAEKVEVVDTTAAGDTFIGYFLASIIEGMDVEKALRRAGRAAAIAVSRSGAMESVPTIGELEVQGF